MRGATGPRLGCACLIVAFVVAACGSSSASSSPKRSGPTSSSTSLQVPTPHALDIAAKIKAAGLGCADATNDPGPHPDSLEASSCTIGDDDLAITLWADHAALLRAVPLGGQGICFVAKSNPGENLTYVEGVNWIAFPQQAANARKIAAATSGVLRTIDCGTPMTSVVPCGPSQDDCTATQVIATVVRLYQTGGGATPAEAACLALITGRGTHAVNQALDRLSAAQTRAAIRCVGSEARLRRIVTALANWFSTHPSG